MSDNTATSSELLEYAIDDAVRMLPLRDGSRKGQRYARERVRQLANLVPGLKISHSEKPGMKRRLTRLLDAIAQLEKELGRLAYPDRLFWKLHVRHADERMRNADLPLTDDMLLALKQHLEHLGKLAHAEQCHVRKALPPFRRPEHWQYWFVLRCHTVFMELCDINPTMTPTDAFSGFVSKVYESATGESGKTFQDQIKRIVGQNTCK